MDVATYPNGPPEGTITLPHPSMCWRAGRRSGKRAGPRRAKASAGQRGGMRAPVWRLRVTRQLGSAASPAERGPGVGVAQIDGRLREHPGEDATAYIGRRVEATAEALRDVVAVQQRLVAAQCGETLWVGHTCRVEGADVRGRRAHHRGQDAAAGHRELQYLRPG